jgi:toxin ParE1/3/4
VAGVEISTAAETDLIDIWLHIAADDPSAADRQLDHFDRIFALLVAQPFMGTDRSVLLHPGVRSFVVDHYLVFYQVGDRVRILRVLHGARDWLTVLDDPDVGDR